MLHYEPSFQPTSVFHIQKKERHFVLVLLSIIYIAAICAISDLEEILTHFSLSNLIYHNTQHLGAFVMCCSKQHMYAYSLFPWPEVDE